MSKQILNETSKTMTTYLVKRVREKHQSKVLAKSHM